MRRCKMTIAAPQQRHTSCGRSVGGAGGALNTSSRSSAISRLLLGCKKPWLRERREPVGNTCCSTSHRKAAPRTVRVIDLPDLLSRQR